MSRFSIFTHLADAGLFYFLCLQSFWLFEAPNMTVSITRKGWGKFHQITRTIEIDFNSLDLQQFGENWTSHILMSWTWAINWILAQHVTFEWWSLTLKGEMPVRRHIFSAIEKLFHYQVTLVWITRFSIFIAKGWRGAFWKWSRCTFRRNH